MKLTSALAISTVVAAACFGAANARADVVYTNAIISQDATNYAGAGLSVSLPQFSTALGSLTGIVITVSTSSIADISISNNSQTTSYPITNATAVTTLGVSGPLGYSAVITTISTLTSGTAVAGSGGVNGISDYPGVSGNSTSQVVIPANDLASYEGAGTLSLSFVNYSGSASYGGTAVGAPSNTVYFGGGDDLAVNVSIDYETVPEPASMAILGTALLGAGGLRRIRRS